MLVTHHNMNHVFMTLEQQQTIFLPEELPGLNVENLFGNIKFLNIKYFFAKINSSTDGKRV